MRRLPYPLLLALLAALLLAAPPAAEAAGGPKARADAQRLVRMHAALNRQMEPLAAAVEEDMGSQLENCAAQPPDDVDTTWRLASIYIRDLATRGEPQLSRFVRRMQTFSTRDRTVRRVARRLGRAWGLIRELGGTPPKFCDYLQAWQSAGWPDSFRISPPVRNLTPEEVSSAADDRRVVRRSAKRLRALGVSRARLADLLSAWDPPDGFGRLAL